MEGFQIPYKSWTMLDTLVSVETLWERDKKNLALKIECLLSSLIILRTSHQMFVIHIWPKSL